MPQAKAGPSSGAQPSSSQYQRWPVVRRQAGRSLLVLSLPLPVAPRVLEFYKIVLGDAANEQLCHHTFRLGAESVFRSIGTEVHPPQPPSPCLTSPNPRPYLAADVPI